MNKLYRLILCGTGGVGGGALREALRMPWINVVGVLVYSDEKNGVDIGDDSNDDIFVRLLESGKNVVTALAYHRPQLRNSGATLTAKLEAACRVGGVSFHANGINPGYILERLTLLATGITNGVKHIKAEEFFNCEQLHESLMGMFGIGKSVEEAKQIKTALYISNLYLSQGIEYVCEQLGVKVDRIEQEQFFTETVEDIKTIDMEIKAGTVASTMYRWTAYVDNKPFFIKENNWFMGKSMQPINADTTENWLITVEGRPSVKLFLEAEASWDENLHLYENDPTPPGYYATAVPLIQMIPTVCEAKPGIVWQQSVGPHWTADMETGPDHHVQ